MIGAAVDAPGEAPSRPAMVPSAEVTISVPSFSTPPAASSRLMICTRWPACHRRQSSALAFGKYSFRAFMRYSSDSMSWPARYSTSGYSLMPTLVIGQMLWVVVLVSRSRYEPSFRNLVEKVANGPNRITRLPRSEEHTSELQSL